MNKLSKRNKFGLPRRVAKAFDEALALSEGRGEHKPNMELMHLNVITSKTPYSKHQAHTVESTSCTIGLSVSYMLRDEGLLTETDGKLRYITSRIPLRTLREIKKGGERADAIKAFYGWLVNESPYANAFVIKSLDKIFEAQHFLITADIDFRIMVESIMCTRYVWEDWCKNYCLSFKKFIDAGVSGNMAFQATYWFKAGDFIVGAKNYGHSAPQINMLKKETLARFVLLGKMSPLSKEDYESRVRRYTSNLSIDSVIQYYGSKGTLKGKNIGGFLSGSVSSGWGCLGLVEDRETPLKQVIKELLERVAKQKGLFSGAWSCFVGEYEKTVPNTPENFQVLAKAVLAIEKDLVNHVPQ